MKQSIVKTDLVKRINQCCLCDVIAGEKRYGLADSCIMESENFIAIPSIGAFIEGWAMIVPRGHDLSMRKFYADDEFTEFRNRVAERIRREYGELIMFEHGAAARKSPTGCGVDHAHFHIVPSPSLLSDLSKSSLHWDSVTYSEMKTRVGAYQDYLFYSDDSRTGSGKLHQLDSPLSQYFRKILAKKNTLEGQSDYKEHLYIENSSQTYVKLAGF